MCVCVCVCVGRGKKLYHNIFTINFTLCLFHWKTFCKDSFPHFPVFGSTKKTWSMENYLWSMENSNKNKAYFIQVVFQFFFFWKTIPHFFSLPFTFSLLTPSLSLTLVSPLPQISLSLSLSLSLFLFPFITQFSDQIPPPLTDRSIVLTCKGEQICSGNYLIPFYQNLNSLL